jgi:hypothetical protein
MIYPPAITAREFNGEAEGVDEYRGVEDMIAQASSGR